MRCVIRIRPWDADLTAGIRTVNLAGRDSSMAQTLLLRAPSNAVLTVELDPEPVVCTTATDARYAGAPGDGTYTLQMGSLGYQDIANEAILPATIVDRFVVDGREVRLAVGNEGVNATAALIDQWHEAMLVYTGPPPSRFHVYEAFSKFSFEDSPEGMAAIPRPGTGLQLMSEAVKIVVPDRGSLNAPGLGVGPSPSPSATPTGSAGPSPTVVPTSRPTIVPSFTGLPTRHGEVWRIEGQLPDRPGNGANTYIYIIGTPAGAAEVIFDAEPTVDDATLLGWLDTINLAWS